MVGVCHLEAGQSEAVVNICRRVDFGWWNGSIEIASNAGMKRLRICKGCERN